jgi:hypothetical protein
MTAALRSRRENADTDREDEKFDMGRQENKKSLVTYIFKRNAQKSTLFRIGRFKDLQQLPD